MLLRRKKTVSHWPHVLCTSCVPHLSLCVKIINEEKHLAIVCIWLGLFHKTSLLAFHLHYTIICSHLLDALKAPAVLILGDRMKAAGCVMILEICLSFSLLFLLMVSLKSGLHFWGGKKGAHCQSCDFAELYDVQNYGANRLDPEMPNPVNDEVDVNLGH